MTPPSGRTPHSGPTRPAPTRAAPVPWIALGLAVAGFSLAFQAERTARQSVERDLARVRLQVQALATAQREAAKALSPPGTETPPLPAPTPEEWNRLNAELDQVKARTQELERSTASVSNLIAAARGDTTPFIYPDSTRKKDYAFRGLATPQAAWESMLWAIAQGDVRAYRNTLDTAQETMFAETYKDLPEGIMPGGFKNGLMYRANGFRILEETALSDTETRLKIFMEGRQNLVLKPVFKKDGNDWKHARME